MRIGVVIPTYNRANLLAETLDAILAQTVAPDRVVVVDDGSTDHTPDVLARYAARAGVQSVRVPNGGDLAARNVGTGLCDTDLVAYCDSDDLWTPEHLARMAAFWQACPELRVAYADFRIVRDGVWQKSRKFDDAPGGFWDGLEPLDAPAGAGIFRAPIVARLIGFQPFFPSAMVVRRADFLAAGGWDEVPGRIVIGDFATALRMAECVPFGVLRQPSVGIRKHGHNLSGDVQRMTLGESLVLEHVLRTRPSLAPCAAAIRSSIIHRRLAALDTAFARHDYAGVRDILALIPPAGRSRAAVLKAAVANLPPPLRGPTANLLLAAGSFRSRMR